MGSKVELEVGIKSGLVSTGLAKIRGQFQQLRAHLNSDIGTAISVGGLIAGAAEIGHSLDRVKDLSDRFNETAESIQRTDVAARLFGSDIEQVAKGVGKASLSALKATRDGGTMATAFKDLGLEAGSFINLPLEAKLVALSEAYQRAQGSGAALAQMQEILGRGAGELIPLLAQGPEELKRNMDEAIVASQTVVDSVDRFYDSLIKLKSAASVLFGFIIQSLLTVAAAWGTGSAAAIGIQRAMFTALKDGWVEYTKIVKAGLLGNVAGVKDAAMNLPGIFRRAIDESRSAVVGAADEMEAQLNKIWGRTENTRGAGPKLFDEAAADDAAEAAKKAATEEEKKAKEIAELKKQVGDAERDRYLRNLEAETRINDLIKERLGLQLQLNAITDEKGKLETRLKIADVDKQIEATNREIADRQKQSDSDEARLVSLQRENALKNLKPPEQLKQLREELSKIDDQIKTAKDIPTEVKLKIEREEKVGDISSLEEQIKNRRGRGVSADFLAEIGGGGRTGTGGTVDPIVYEQRQGNKILERIEQNTRHLGDTTPKQELMKP
jgi:hypothetical protein